MGTGLINEVEELVTILQISVNLILADFAMITPFINRLHRSSLFQSATVLAG